METPCFQDVILQAYNKELSDREIIFNRSNIHITVSMTLIAGMAYVAKNIEIQEISSRLIIIYILIFIWLVLILISLFFTRKALTDYKYHEMPKASDIIEYYKKSISYREEIILYNKSNTDYLNASCPQQETNLLVLDSLVEASDLNHQTNQERRNNLVKSLKFILASAPIMIGIAVIFIIFDMDASSPRKDNSIQDRQLTKAVAELNLTLQSKFNSLNQDIKVVTKNTNSSAGSSTASNSPPVQPVQVNNPQNAPKKPERPKLQISNESYDPPLRNQVLTEIIKK